MKWYAWVIVFLVLLMISIVALFTPLFTNLTWYWWVIIVLTSIIATVASCFFWAINQGSNAVGNLLGELVAKPWLKGNFGKRK